MPTIIPRVSFANAPRQKRIMRHPKHPFHIKQFPFGITPFFFAPVLPGETMKNMLLQARAVSKTVVNPLIGAWIEYYFFYIKFSDFTDIGGTDYSAAYKDMILTPGRAMTDVDTVAKYEHAYTKVVTTPGGNATQMDFLFQAQKRIIDTYFRDADETFATAGGTYATGATTQFLSHLRPSKDFTDSLIQDVEFTSKDIDVDLDADATITAQEVETAMMQWSVLKQGRLTDMTFDDYLIQQGVNRGLAQQGEHIPEHIRTIRDFSYPANTVDPTDGDPSSAFSWSITESADKDRFFAEPGFLIGLTIFRPKIYLSKQTASMSGFLNDVYSWLPNAILGGEGASKKKFLGATSNSPNESDGPFDDILDDYWLDVKDLYLYGEQFTNVTLSDADVNFIDTTNSDKGNRKYATEAQMNTIFQGAASIDGMEQDGIVSLSILGQQVDTSPTTGQEDDA